MPGEVNPGEGGEEARLHNQEISQTRSMFVRKTSRLRVNTTGLEGRCFASTHTGQSRGLSRTTTRIMVAPNLLKKKRRIQMQA